MAVPFDGNHETTIHPELLNLLKTLAATHRHYKGDEYVFLGVTRESTNGEDDGNAKALYWSVAYEQLCVRDLDQFNDTVRIEVKRFAPLDAKK